MNSNILNIDQINFIKKLNLCTDEVLSFYNIKKSDIYKFNLLSLDNDVSIRILHTNEIEKKNLQNNRDVFTYFYKYDEPALLLTLDYIFEKYRFYKPVYFIALSLIQNLSKVDNPKFEVHENIMPLKIAIEKINQNLCIIKNYNINVSNH